MPLVIKIQSIFIYSTTRLLLYPNAIMSTNSELDESCRALYQYRWCSAKTAYSRILYVGNAEMYIHSVFLVKIAVAIDTYIACILYLQ